VTPPDPAERPSIDTQAAHPPAAPVPVATPLGLPVYRTSAFVFDTAEEYADVLGGRAEGYVYSRIDNPTADAFAQAVAALEGAPAAQPFASGMAAISTTLLTFLSAGDHVVAHSALYGGTYSLLHSLLPRFGVTATFVENADIDALARAMRPETKVVWGELIANPTLAVADLAATVAVAHDAGARVVIDATFASPVLCRPLEFGVDVVVHSATKYIGGHADATGGVALGGVDDIAAIRAVRSDLGGALAPDEAFLLHRGLATMPLRVARQSASALTLARVLADHPRVAAVSYPGLPSHPQHGLAALQFDIREGQRLYGGVVTVSPVGDRQAGVALCNRLQLAHNATSLGGVMTKVSHVASTTHRQLDDDALATAGIAPSAVRVSVGLEDPADIVADFEQALG
jgi:cystathionine gamma-synthase/O-acetylhomoserine (thiol)-lyase